MDGAPVDHDAPVTHSTRDPLQGATIAPTRFTIQLIMSEIILNRPLNPKQIYEIRIYYML